ncbi:MAG: arginine--tRNA ligase [Candidatus Yonathbacteria bacterium]|nr:arginine--tRNA ligase [Candidatus Yonathbacteria bacterium]
MIREILQSEVRNAVRAIALSADVTKVAVVCSEHFGDYASNIPLILAKSIGKNPLEAGEEIKKEMLKSPTAVNYIKEISIAKPGFLNITVSDNLILKEGKGLDGQLEKGFDFLKHKKINIEFISANPTGDLHIGHGRGAVYGDILSSILSYAGAEVTREFYINDSKESNQIKELGKTALGKGEQYKTPRLEEIIKNINVVGTSENDAGFLLAEHIVAYNRNFIREKLGITFDTWYSEEEHIRQGKRAENILKMLKDGGFTYEKEGAVWLKTGEFGDDEDRVIVRSDGTASYFLSDIAYHAEKMGRGYDTVVDMWGADHHGHVKRIQAVKKMLEWNGELIVFITQLVSLKEGKQTKKMSKRLGNVILLEDLVDELGVDVVRWFYAEKAISTHMEFDMELAREESPKNPVYYVQYAHARINSIAENVKNLSADKSTMNELMKEASARSLALKIAEFPEIVEDISKDYQIHKLTTYAYELASEFSQFYRDVRIIGDASYHKGALELALLAKKTLAQSLKLLGISAPERM